jgi:hypothetical protein
MPFRLCIFVTLLSLCSHIQAQEKEVLPIDLIELLGELDEDDQDALATAMGDAEIPASASKQPQKIEVGGQK